MSAALKKVFKGKFVRVLESGPMQMQVNELGEASPIETGMAHQGYFVDSDDRFVILGDKKGKRLIGMFAISLDSITNVMFGDPSDTEDSGPVPRGELN